MSLAATTRAYACRPRSATAKLILIWLADYANEAAEAPIVMQELSDFAMCSLDVARVELRSLADDGFISQHGQCATVLGVAQ